MLSLFKQLTTLYIKSQIRDIILKPKAKMTKKHPSCIAAGMTDYHKSADIRSRQITNV